MIHILIVAAVVLFILWLLFHAAGALVNLLWIVIIVLAVIWLWGLLRGAGPDGAFRSSVHVS